MQTSLINYFDSGENAMEIAKDIAVNVIPAAAGGAALGAAAAFGVGYLGAKVSDKYPAHGTLGRALLDTGIGAVTGIAVATQLDDVTQQVAVAAGAVGGGMAPAVATYGMGRYTAMVEASAKTAVEALQEPKRSQALALVAGNPSVSYAQALATVNAA